MTKYTITADPRVADDLIEARDFLNSRRKGYGKKFLNEYRSFLKSLQHNPFFEIRYKQVHCVPLKTFKYMIHFSINTQTKVVHIYAVLSNYQNPNQHWIK